MPSCFGVQGDRKAERINGADACALFLCPHQHLNFSKKAQRRLSHISCCRHGGESIVESEVSMKGGNQHITKRSDDNWHIEDEEAGRASPIAIARDDAGSRSKPGGDNVDLA